MNTDRYRSTLIAASVIAALGVGVAACDKNAEPAYTGTTDDSRSTAGVDRDMNMDMDRANMAADSAGQAASDTWITTKVKSELLADSLAKGFDVNVETKDGVVALEGTLQDQAAIDHVTRIAAGVENVVSVDASRLTVAR